MADSSGTYTLLGLGGTITRSAQAGAVVVYNLTGILTTFRISSAAGANVTVNNTVAVANNLDLDTVGGTIGIGTLAGALGTVDVTIDGGGTFFAGGSVLSLLDNGTVTYSTGGGTAVLGTAGSFIDLSFAPIFSGFNDTSDIIDDRALNFGGLTSYTVTGTGTQSVSITDSFGNFSFTTVGSNLIQGTFTSANFGDGSLRFSDDGFGGTDITLCYCRGTRILTDTGEHAVEDLAIGDRIVTYAGELRPIRWIGRRRINVSAHPHPKTVAPVRIRRNAFADGLPHTDLLVSPDHAIFVEDCLICAHQLINGTTICAETDVSEAEYYHLELDGHAILFAEGLPAESYLDTGNRDFFANSGRPLVLHPDLTDKDDHPARAAGSCAPFVSDQAQVWPVWRRLADRAATLSPATQPVATTFDADMLVLAQGRVVAPIRTGQSEFIFPLPANTTKVHLLSRASAPADARPWFGDRRCLGMSVERIVLRNANTLEIPLDHPSLAEGWWEVERHGRSLRRWTNGDAAIPLPPLDSPSMLEIRASSCGLNYLTDAHRKAQAA